MRTFILAVTGFVLSVAACSSYGTSVVEVEKIRAAVASVSVSIPRSLEAGQTARAVATIKDASGATLPDRTLEWYTSSASIASVTDSGMVSAVAPGDAILSAVSEGVAGQATVAVIAPPPTPTPVATVLVAITPASVIIGQKAQATATLQDANGNPLSGRIVTWQSSNSSIASVAPTGDVSAVGAGTATITAASEGQTGLAALTVTVPAPIAVASVSVSPATATLQVGGTVQLAAVTRDANNNVLTGRTIIWGSGNTSIAAVSALGLVTAIASGSLQISASSEGQMASSAITVSAPPPPPPAPAPVASVSVSPASSTLQAGATVQLSAVTRDSSNNLLTGRVISWSSSNISISTVSASGLVTAVAAGTAQITATSETKMGTSSITVSAPPPPPPPPSGSVEPAGMTLIANRPFNTLNDGSWTDGWGVTIVNDPAAPMSPSSIGQQTFPAGFTGGNSNGSAGKVIGGTCRTLYTSVWMKISSNWQGHLTGANKVLHIFIGGSNHVVLNLWGTGSGTMQAGILLQGIVNDGTGSTGASWYPNLGPTGQIVRGQWHHIEMVFVGNTSGAANGSVDWWLNGVKIGSHSGIQYVGGNGLWEEVLWSPTWGGSGGVVASTMTMAFDHIYMSGK